MTARWVIVVLVAFVAMLTDIKWGKISNRLNLSALLLGLLFLCADYDVSYLISAIISIIFNLFVVGKLYMGGDAKLMINISLLIGFWSLYVLFFLLMLMLIIYIYKMARNYLKSRQLSTGGKTICGPQIFISVILCGLLFFLQ